jgi:hypothetical protein
MQIESAKRQNFSLPPVRLALWSLVEAFDLQIFRLHKMV